MKRKFTFAILLAFIISIVCIPVSYCDEFNPLGIIASFDSNGETVQSFPAFAGRISETEAMIVYDGQFTDEDEKIGVAFNSGAYSVTYKDGNFIMEYDSSIPEILSIGEVEVGDTAYICYFGKDGRKKEKFTVEELGENGVPTIPVPDGAKFPVVAINSSGELVGYVINSSSDAGSSSGGSSSGGSGSEGSDSGGSGSGGTSGGIGGIFDRLGVLGYAILGAIVALIVYFIKKKKTSNTGNGQSGEFVNNSAQNCDQVGGADNFGGFDNFGGGIGQEQFVGSTEPLTNGHGMSPEPSGRRELHAEGGVMNGRVYYYTGSDVTIGRSSGSTIKYPADAKGVSRMHCRITMRDNRLYLVDAGSSYGTFVEGIGKIEPHKPVEIGRGSVFYIGDKRNKYTVR